MQSHFTKLLLLKKITNRITGSKNGCVVTQPVVMTHSSECCPELNASIRLMMILLGMPVKLSMRVLVRVPPCNLLPDRV